MESCSQEPDTQVLQNQQWMSQLCETLWDIPLYDLSIPGSHDTMTYCLDRCSPIDPDSPKLLLFLGKYVPSLTRKILLRWCMTQTLTVAEQLDAGIRYLDLRIAHRPDIPSPNLYFVHGLYTFLTVEEILNEISDWMTNNPKEILILACRNLQSMSPVHHMHLISCIQRIFGSKLCPKHEPPTLRNMWKKGFQVIVSYDNNVTLKNVHLWPSIPYWWADTTNKHSLINFLEKKKHSGRPGEFFVAGLNLTENTSYVLKHPLGSMKKLTLPKLPFLNSWVQKQHPGVSKDATNIMAEDLIGSGQFISDVIDLNHKLLLHKN
ncbi:PI-PLC X domain-containing protein 1 isoform X1 [Rana temporaria]|uniref:PI-PLC X domain-containing protein 1 isoform X1 n=2 Tax=Rana temporaria TaxID=8407 RepID=UPI001AACF00C|nr:PI-PLC X domain-containing protein 1 isoform X1 [Rana temporaria]XP_040192222.1 PI-PLC X domain-containing protein 1 isoform X1 [Rana temporaria]